MDETHAPPPTHERLELQYCERCGALWLRPASLANLCPRCTARDAAGARRPAVTRKPYHPRRTS
jgi:Zn-finger nucleic acid-binding protein